MTAAAGAQGAEIRRGVPPKVEATMPMAIVPRMAAMAPTAADAGPRGGEMRRPKAIAAGGARSLPASPPQISPARCAPPGAVDGTGVVTAGILVLPRRYCKRC